MKILVTGIRGQLGWDVMKVLKARNIEAVGVNSDDMDITDRESVDRVFAREMPDAVIHCAAWTAVDAAEDEEAACRAVNVDGTAHIAEACRRTGAVMMYFSTDYVFNGEGETPWKPDDPTGPASVYGQSKLDGENAVRRILPDRHFIIRLQWVYGINGKNFVKTMLRLSETHSRLTVVCDQIGGPSYTPDLARLACDMIVTDRFGTYHAANTGFCSWYEFAKAIFAEAGKEVEVVPVSSDQYPAKAKRPHNSRLDTSKLTENGFDQLPSWQDALHRFILELNAQA
ncbi:MAG: dTDP-4-dehydrorhamnose reductase [Lachnospiraceae bacterium]|nr:dTDP-4-dehydrorhamnose reductase [Lachnospiraceae bacterium]